VWPRLLRKRMPNGALLEDFKNSCKMASKNNSNLIGKLINYKSGY